MPFDHHRTYWRPKHTLKSGVTTASAPCLRVCAFLSRDNKDQIRQENIQRNEKEQNWRIFVLNLWDLSINKAAHQWYVAKDVWE